MTAGRRPPEPFSRAEIAEIGERPWGSEIEEATTTGRRVESAGQIAARPSAAFADRVMAAVALEPVPAPAIAAGEAARHGRLAAFVAAIGDGWRVLIGGGHPLSARAQGLALVLVALLAVGSASTLVAVGAANMLRGESGPIETPAPSVAPSVAPVTSPTLTPSATTSPQPSPSPSPTVSRSPDPTPASTVRPTTTPSPTRTPDDTPEATRTLRPAETLKPGETLKAGETLRPAETQGSDDNSGSGSNSGSGNSGSGSGSSGSGSNSGSGSSGDD